MITKATGSSCVGPILCAFLPLLMILPIQPAQSIVASEPAQASSALTALQEKISRQYKDLQVARQSPQWTPQADRGQVAQIEDAITAYLTTRLNTSPSPTFAILGFIFSC
jgi:hypothetical protein